MKKRMLALGLALVMTASMAACGGAKKEEPAPAPADTQKTETQQAEAPAETGDKTFKIGICQLVQHPALDAATKGFIEAIKAEMGDAVEFDEQNASGETANCSTIVDGFVSNNYDLILANATAPLQAAASATSTIPVLGTSITDYATALEIADWTGTVGTNVSGTSDLAPLDEQANAMKEILPDAKVVGILYCSAEANSEYQANVMEENLTKLGYEVKRYTFNDTNDVASVTQTACDNCDAIYIPTDNAAASNTEAIANVLVPAKTPAFCGEEGICSGCGVATLSISYYDLGTATGKMAVEILKNGADVSQMAVEYAPQVTKKYNASICEQLGITVPEGYEAIQ